MCSFKHHIKCKVICSVVDGSSTSNHVRQHQIQAALFQYDCIIMASERWSSQTVEKKLQSSAPQVNS